MLSEILWTMTATKKARMTLSTRMNQTALFLVAERAMTEKGSEASQDGTASYTSTSASAEQENVFKDDAVDMEDAGRR